MKKIDNKLYNNIRFRCLLVNVTNCFIALLPKTRKLIDNWFIKQIINICFKQFVNIRGYQKSKYLFQNYAIYISFIPIINVCELFETVYLYIAGDKLVYCLITNEFRLHFIRGYIKPI